MPAKNIVLDANILIRSVLGIRVRELLEKYHHQVGFFTAAKCFEEAQRHLPTILSKKPHANGQAIMDSLEILTHIVHPIDEEVYSTFKKDAQQRITARDPHDWHLVALSLLLECPIWTEDRDFFGTGIAVWNTQNVELYLSTLG